jgi:Arc/MetJ-type ribon-helix-helix transcriptional regulator
MAKSIKVHPKKRRGRPATGKDPLVSARLPQPLIDEIDQWATSNEASRSEAMRRLVELGLTVKANKPKHAPAARAARAKELASKAIDSLTVGAPDNDENASRKRRLIKGPEEFHDMRVDRAKAKGSPK